MGQIKLTDGTTLNFEKDKKKKRFLVTIKTMIDKKERKVTLHLTRTILNWISLEVEDLINE